ncbi:MAG: winged helix-turn-helix transcriptional regulator [Acidimicrobiales bacterium]
MFVMPKTTRSDVARSETTRPEASSAESWRAPASKALSAALERVGDRWTLLLVEALLGGSLRFGELQQAVPAIATNVLTSRLRDLERQGLVVSLPYSRRPLRLEYDLTASGAELAGVLKILAAWGSGADRSGQASTPERTHAICGTPLEVRYWCPTCQQVAEGDEEVWA